MSKKGPASLADVREEVIAPNVATPQTMIGQVPMREGVFIHRAKEGWVISFVNVPENQVRAFTIKTDGPHNSDIASAKLEEWFLKRCYKTGV